MSQYFEYNDPIKVIWRKGDEIDPYPPLSDTQKIINNTILLTEIPDEFNHVSIEGYAEIYGGKPEPAQFRVNYRTGVVFFNSSEEGKTVIANYFGRGQILSPATRVYIHNENPDVVETLQDMIDDGKQAIDALGGINTAIEMAQTLETELDSDITTGNTLHTNLQDNINQGNTLKTELETTTIPNSVNAKANLETTITTANDKDVILNSTINDANTTKLNLDNSISAANTTKTNLNGSISTANTVKNNLEDSVTDANNINETLLNPTTGAIKKATDINSDLNNTIVTANTTKTNLGNIISTAQNTKTDLETSIAAGDLENYVQKTEKGMANGVATLDEKGNIPANQLNYVDTKANQAEQNANNYTDQQITLVTETGIPKLNVYEYKINADVDDSEFIIPLETFDKNTDTIRLYINTTFKDSDFYTVVNSVFENDVLIENAKIVLNTPLSCPSKVVIEVFKNIPMGEEGSVSGVVLAPNTVDDTRIGERTIDDALDPNTSNNGFITDVFNWFANRIKSITGKPSWKDAPTKNMEEINTTLSAHLNDNVNPHNVTAAQVGAAPSSHIGATGSAHGTATTSAAGFMSAADKAKLNSIEEGATGTQTASEILTALKTVDGSGSGLDADTLDGQHAATFENLQFLGNYTKLATDAPSSYRKGITHTCGKSSDGWPFSYTGIITYNMYGNQAAIQYAYNYQNGQSNIIYVRSATYGTDSWGSWNTVYHSGNLTPATIGAAPAAHVNDTTVHITSAERSAWNGKEPAFTKNTAFNKAFGTASGTVCQGNDSRLSNSRKCNNTFDNVSTARSNLGLTGTSNTTHYHDSRYVQTRVYNGSLQYYNGGWKNVMVSPIKSIQRGIVTPVASNADTNITISSINANKAVVIIDGIYAQYNDRSYMPIVKNITSTTLVLSYSHSSGGDLQKISWQIIEYV